MSEEGYQHQFDNELRVLHLEMRAGFAETRASIGELRTSVNELRQDVIERFDAVLAAVADLAADYRRHSHTDDGDVAP